jgi:hypothetical protein
MKILYWSEGRGGLQCPQIIYDRLLETMKKNLFNNPSTLRRSVKNVGLMFLRAAI